MNLGNIRSKGIIFFVLVVLVLLLQSWLTHRQADRVYEEAVLHAKRYQPTLEYSHSMQVAVIQVQQWLTDISATRGLDGLNDGFGEAEAAANQFRETLAELSRLEGGYDQRYQSLLPVFENYYQSGISMAQAYVAGGPAEGNKMMAQFDKVAAAIYQQIDELMVESKANAELSVSEQINNAQLSKNLGDLFLIVLAAIFMLLFAGLIYYILKPIQAMQRMIDELSEGRVDLTRRLELQGNDEITQLGRGVNRFIEHSDSMVSGIVGSVVKLVPLSQSLANTNLVIREQATEQNQHSQLLLDSIHSTSAVAQQVYDSACKINEATTYGDKVVHESNAVVDQVSQSIQQFSTEMISASAAIEQLKQDSNQVSSVIDVINGIAEQTNLLALNAAIEAARAGESGRGFAVVADEVRSLAAKTRQSTMEVQSMVEAIQRGTQQVVVAMEMGQANSAENVSEIEQARKNLNHLEEVISNISGTAEEIVQSVALQNNSFGEVSDSVSAMNRTFQEALQEGEVSVQYSRDMSSLSESLQQELEAFKVTGKAVSPNIS